MRKYIGLLLSTTLFFGSCGTKNDSQRREVVEFVSNLRQSSDFYDKTMDCKQTNTYIKDAQVNSQMQFRRFKILNLDSFIAEATSFEMNEKPSPEAYKYMTIYNDGYNAGITKETNLFSLVNVNEHNTFKARNYNQFGALFLPVGQSETFEGLLGKSTTQIQSWEQDNENDLATLCISTPDSKSYRFVFDRLRKFCIKQEVVNSERPKMTVIANFDNPNREFPTSISFESDSVKDKYKTVTTFEILEILNTSGISSAETFLSHYGLPEPEFPDSDKKIQPRRILAVTGIVVFLTCILVVSRKFFARRN